MTSASSDHLSSHQLTRLTQNQIRPQQQQTKRTRHSPNVLVRFSSKLMVDRTTNPTAYTLRHKMTPKAMTTQDGKVWSISKIKTNHSISPAFPSLILFLLATFSSDQQQMVRAEASDAGPLWLAHGDRPAPPVSARLNELLGRVGPNMRASADYHDFRDVKLNDSLEGWQVLHGQVKEYASKQVLANKPKVIQLLNEANVSAACLRSSDETLDSMSRLESWAVQMWSYSGNFPPVAFFDGQYHDLGSYKGCIDIVRPENAGNHNSQREQKHLASYCTIGFRPVVPARPRFHLIFKQAPQTLINLFNQTNIMGLMANQAQYFYYIYLKTGICVPSQCSSRDMQQVAKTIGRKLALISAPVKCFTRTETMDLNATYEFDDLNNLENNKPVQVHLNRKMNSAQLVSLIIILAFFSIVLVATVWHCLELAWREITIKRKLASSIDLSDNGYRQNQHQSGHGKSQQLECDTNNSNNHHQLIAMDHRTKTKMTNSSTAIETFIQTTDNCFKTTLFYYFSILTNGREFCDTSMRSNEIKCLHGFRVFTMLWIICVHVLQYNDWSGFTRVYENVPSLQNPFLHPIINANYVVDNFFLMSGLLAAYTTWHSKKGSVANFSMFQSLLGRYLRLTPQVLLISLLYILLPLFGDGGPFWYDMTHYESKYCEKNWWVNLLHLQAFYRDDEICNLVGWWISVDMFYYIVGLLLLWMILDKRLQMAYACTGLFVGFCTFMTIWRHYSWGLTPNNLGLVPQVNEVWTEFVVKFFWSPYPHAYVFFLGVWLGYLMANKIGIHQVRRWSKLGWVSSLTTLAVINLSSRLWLNGTLELTPDLQVLSTSYNVICVIGWSSSFGWMIVACHYGCAPFLNKILSTKACIMLSKASFIIYLSHMLVLRTFYGTQYSLFEISTGILLFLAISISFISVLLGVFLCVAFEAPCMKVQRLVLSKVKSNRKLPPAGLSYIQSNNIDNKASTSGEEKAALNSGATGVTLFK